MGSSGEEGSGSLKGQRGRAMRVRDHVLDGEGVAQRSTPNRGGEISPRYLVFHYTAGRSAESAVAWLCDPAARASAHLVVARDGGVVQLAPFNVMTWHAGQSHWRGLSGLNAHSIGVEMDNAGRLIQVGAAYRAWFQAEYPAGQVIRARHKNGGEEAHWHAYTEVQIGRALELARLLVQAYRLEDVLGHEDISPGRKVDPGPAFPLENIRSAVLGRAAEGDEVFRVTAEALNIRQGPGIEFPPAAAPLPRGARLRLLEGRDRWSRVEVEGPADLEGWVSNRFIEKA